MARILIVDDDPILLKVSQSKLTSEGFAVEAVSDGAAAVRTLPGYARTPIIFVTALADFESQFKASAHGADDLIGKPFLLMELGTKALLHVLTGDGDLWNMH